MRNLTKSIINKTFIILTVILSFGIAKAQTSTTTGGNWSNAANWTAGVPASGSTVTVTKAMTIDVNISAGGNYTIGQPVTDIAGGAAFILDVSGSLDMTAQGISTFEGALNVYNGGTLTIESGDTLIVGPNSDFANNSNVWIKAGGVLVVKGDLKNDNNSTGIKVDGTIIVLGNFKGWNGSIVAGSGSIQTTGSLTYQGSGQTFGNTTPCNSGPCSTNQFCTTNTVAASQTICPGTPAGLTGNLLSGYTYQWQQSTTSSYSGFSNVASSGMGQNYLPGALSATTYYRRNVTNGTCTVYSVPVTITVNPTSTSVSISSSAGTTICSGTSVTFTATPTNGGTSPSYQWKVNGVNSGSNSATFTTSTLTNGQIVTCVLTSNAPCISPTTGTSNALTMSVNGANTWVGTTSTSWSTASNWCGGAVPTWLTNVIIPAGAMNMPLVSASVNVKNVTINASAKLSNSAAGTLNVYGNFTNNGDYYDLGTTAFVGNASQTISGVADSLNNMIVNDTAGVIVSSAIYVKKNLTLIAGILASGGNLTVDLYVGSILGSGSGSISGNITVVRTIWSDKWHYISSPLSGKTVAAWNTSVPIKFAANSNLYTYDETNTSIDKAIGWTAVTSTGTSLVSMKGYSLYFPRYTYKTNFSMTGAYTHSQTYSISVTNTSSGTPASDGWNLVGNPYPSEIDWDAASGWTKTGINNAIYFFDQANNRYSTYVSGIGSNGGTRYIPCMQGFYVKVTSAGTRTLAITNAARSSVANKDNWRVSSVDPIIRLKASTGVYNDETIIRFTDQASMDFDSELDAYKLSSNGNTPNLYTKLSDVDYSINSLPDTIDKKIIPVKLIAGISGNYTIDADISGFNTSDSVVFEDRLLNKTQDLLANPQYTATLVAGDTTSRFYLHYSKNNQVLTASNHASELESNQLSITAYQQNVSIVLPTQSSTTATIYVCDAVGNKVYTLENVDGSSGKIEFTIPQVNSGIYLVKVQTNTLNKTQQVFLSR